MAYAALTLFKQTLEKIRNPQQEIQSLKEKVSYLLDFLEDVSSENYSLMGINDLEGKMRDAACQGEDIIETYLSSQSSTSFWEIFRTWIRIEIPAFHRYKLLKKTIKEFDFVLGSVSKIKDRKFVELPQPARNALTAGLSRISYSKKSAMVGLEGDLIQMKDQLTGSSSHLKIISILGMAGIGKTTLAKNLYNDSLIQYHFDIRAWVTVCQNFHCQQFLRDLLNSMRHVNGESHDHIHDQLSIDQLAEDLYKSLKGRRYLIVMDDVWNTKACDNVKRLLPDDNNGSRIILTTQISEVALYANSFSFIHHMSLLSLEESWTLLCEEVFGEESCPSELEEIGKKIAWSCKGLPLTIVVIGGLLCTGSTTQDYWEYIARNVMSAVTGNDDRMMEILSLSYNNLPHHLKACFLYMGVFPKDHEILVSRLIKLWVAEGFLKAHYSKTLEEVAEGYLKDLVDRNLIMVGKQNHNGKIKTCLIHDTMRDLCVKKAREENFLLVLDSIDSDFPELGYGKYRISFLSFPWCMGHARLPCPFFSMFC